MALKNNEGENYSYTKYNLGQVPSLREKRLDNASNALFALAVQYNIRDSRGLNDLYNALTTGKTHGDVYINGTRIDKDALDQAYKDYGLKTLKSHTGKSEHSNSHRYVQYQLTHDGENGYESLLKKLADYDEENNDSSESAQAKALNAYYTDAYGWDTEGTTANSMYNQMVKNEQAAAREGARLADLQAQSAALQQAQTVKAIADQVRNERMAKLRSGMSEAQIANSDMQSMMANMNSLNQQQNELNAARLAAQSQYGNAQATAYNNWLAQATQQATAGSAYSAADAGDAVTQALRAQQLNGGSFESNLKKIQGQYNNK